MNEDKKQAGQAVTLTDAGIGAIQDEISLVLSDPDSALSSGAIRALKYVSALLAKAAPPAADARQGDGGALSDEIASLNPDLWQLVRYASEKDQGIDMNASDVRAIYTALSRASSSRAEQMLKSAAEHGMDLGNQPVAYEFYNKETGHAIVDYTRWTHVGHLTETAGYAARPLVYASSSRAEMEIPEGYALVPRELTPAMRKAVSSAYLDTHGYGTEWIDGTYRALLAAAEAPKGQ